MVILEKVLFLEGMEGTVVAVVVVAQGSGLVQEETILPLVVQVVVTLEVGVVIKVFMILQVDSQVAAAMETLTI